MSIQTVKEELIKVKILTRRGCMGKHYNNRIQSDTVLFAMLNKATEFLDIDATIEERLFCVIRNIDYRVICVNGDCSGPVPFRRGRYNRCCSDKCANIQKRMGTNMSRSRFNPSMTKEPPVSPTREVNHDEDYIIPVYALEEFSDILNF